MANLRASSSSLILPSILLLLFLYARPTHAFGAGNIPDTSKIEGSNWRHGDIEDTLLSLLISSRAGKKFSKMDVKRVYFGNWLRDYSQAVDVSLYLIPTSSDKSPDRLFRSAPSSMSALKPSACCSGSSAS